LAIRGLADMLAASQNEDDASEAIEMYRYLLAADPEFDNLQRDDGDLADTLHNLASVYYRLDYDDYAGGLWFQAYNLRPNDSSIRKSYSHYLLRARRPDLAAKVAEGAPLDVTEPILQSHVKDLPDSFLDENFDRWWEKA
jgi:Tfp pilus assembly protein PilF